ncbi:hypothetical protein [Vibrio crassostreae]|uniref:hypothetical protein n=1 Tax=Vibrio crassostreae TaxID=246167 RepID=UPI00104A3CDB|nr:hypothetical protein [Vibrio crassostreae]TCT61895.1 hypothetical protein EDB31_13610 [Vibrio crassostreae]
MNITHKKTFKIGLFNLLGLSVLIGLSGCSEPAKVTSTTQLNDEQIEICFDRPFKKGTLFSLNFTDVNGTNFNRDDYANKFEIMYPNNSDSKCYNARLFDYFFVGNSTPKEIKVTELKLSDFTSVEITVATPKGMDNLSKSTPEEIIYNGVLTINL